MQGETLAGCLRRRVARSRNLHRNIRWRVGKFAAQDLATDEHAATDRIGAIKARVEGEKARLKKSTTAKIRLKSYRARLRIKGARNAKEGRRRLRQEHLISAKERVDGADVDDGVVEERVEAAPQIGRRRWGEPRVEARVSRDAGDAIAAKNLAIEFGQIGAAARAVEEALGLPAEPGLRRQIAAGGGGKEGTIRH